MIGGAGGGRDRRVAPRSSMHDHAHLAVRVRVSSEQTIRVDSPFPRTPARRGSGMQPEADVIAGRVDVPPGAEAPKRRPWGRITAVLVVALVTITALAIAVRQPNRPPSITEVSVSSDIATVTTPPTR